MDIQQQPNYPKRQFSKVDTTLPTYQRCGGAGAQGSSGLRAPSHSGAGGRQFGEGRDGAPCSSSGHDRRHCWGCSKLARIPPPSYHAPNGLELRQVMNLIRSELPTVSIACAPAPDCLEPHKRRTADTKGVPKCGTPHKTVSIYGFCSFQMRKATVFVDTVAFGWSVAFWVCLFHLLREACAWRERKGECDRVWWVVKGERVVVTGKRRWRSRTRVRLVAQRCRSSHRCGYC
jgi:hypothetical protein